MGFMTIKELFEKVEKEDRQTRTKEGLNGVSFIDNAVVLEGWYDIDLDRINTKLDLLEWVAHLLAKKWINRNHVYQFLRIVEQEKGISPYKNA